MKTRTSIFTMFAAVLMMAATITACNQNKSDSKTVASTTPASTAGKGDIVFINEDSLALKYDYVKDMTKRLEDKRKNASGDVQSRQQAIQREYAEYQRNANTMTTDQRAAKEQNLQRKGQEFQQYSQNASAEVQNNELSEQQKLYEKISDFVKQYAKEKGYKYILTYKKGATTVLYGDPSLDITADVLKKLNEAYSKDKK